ncbi:hypothetical protein LXM25_04405 [Dyadobacter sp. LJ53]|uniref:hypothetical protein n=1 Tax=Dyadobacter chenwenxiniae TaxID=2906456 RepID=UPI001F268C82|nr:hypothetical protein [Dyadobacter chenwenxiniae]MCF0049287.1 hypothetical protein [Dyadobacter chenwenxiniae]
MPSNAIATGMVDFIVEPESMPAVIEEYVKREIELLAASISDDENMVVKTVEAVKTLEG